MAPIKFKIRNNKVTTYKKLVITDNQIINYPINKYLSSNFKVYFNLVIGSLYPKNIFSLTTRLHILEVILNRISNLLWHGCFTDKIVTFNTSWKDQFSTINGRRSLILDRSCAITLLHINY